jgi:hypothetical protein
MNMSEKMDAYEAPAEKSNTFAGSESFAAAALARLSFARQSPITRDSHHTITL